MAQKRRATRQSVNTEGSKYTDDGEHPKYKKPKRNGKNTTHAKKPKDEREDADENDNHEEADSTPIAPRQSTRASKRTSISAEKPEATNPKASDSQSVKPSAPIPPSTIAPPAIATTAASETNRDANGDQQTFWLLKAEPLPRYENGHNVSFSIDDLAACTKPEPWGGVRNFQARNNMLSMQAGDLGFFYHSNAKPSGIAGILRIVEEAKPDDTAFDPEDPYYDKKSERDKPKWWCVGVEFVSKYEEVLSLARIKEFSGKGGELENFQLVKNARLSVCKVTRNEWEFLTGLAEGNNKEERG